ncbi:hypothetical protein IM660_15575 [Ruania alkalisoli]|uniref:Uncharacterized protein n=1 Tax=Ruania alkalisoli TaxID=2779775 RepID=A0A7M1SR35_9MICO|nr:hypothetical protein [Ruania alkalisoli]QOR70038.1 hypothetical protein IM660_15575 [Ruania alkalisoli]
MTTIDVHTDTISGPEGAYATDTPQPRPVRDSLLPATLSLVAVLALLTGAAVGLGMVVRVVAGYVIG